MSNIVSKIYRFNGKVFRGRRFIRFLEVCKPRPDDKIIDIGGTTIFWKNAKLVGRKIDIINIRVKESTVVNINGCEISEIEGDARALPFTDGDYDVVFSNSVIEHVGDWQDQQAFAHEALRLGKILWIQTPAKEFFIEPHFLTCFIHWFPKQIQKKLVRNFSLWGIINRPTQKDVDGIVDEIRLLTHKEMKILFPGCKIYKERFLGFFVKSYTAYRNR